MNSRRFGRFTRQPADLIGIVLASLLLASIFLPVYQISAQPDVWWDYAWQYRKKVTIDHTMVADPLTDFTVLISVTDSDLSSKAQSNGYDIAFTDQYANKLSHELEFYNAGTLTAWVKVSSLSSTTDTILYMYYGNSGAANQQNVAGTWDSNYVLVQHLKEASGNFPDSTSYSNNGTAVGGLTRNVAGKINRACQFDGSSGYIQVADANTLEGMAALTIQAWVKQSAHHNNGIVNKAGPLSAYTYLLQGWGSPYEGLYFAVSGGGDRAVAPSSSVPLGEWYQLFGVSTGSELKIYVNGLEKASSSKAITVPTDAYPVQIGQNGAGVYFNGLLDEVRISKTARTAAWLSTEYNNQNSPSTFCTFGAEEIPPAEIIISNETPSNGAVNAVLNPTLRAHFANYQGLMNITISTNASGTWEIIISYQNAGTGYHSADTTNMNEYLTKYWWKVDAEDNVHGKSDSKTYSFTTKPLNVAPLISNPSPADESTGVSLPLIHLYFNLTDLESDPMNYTVTTQPNIGQKSGTNVGDGRYSVDVSGVKYSTDYSWTINTTDGKDSTLVAYTFRTQQLPAGTEKIGEYACMGLDYVGTATDKNKAYAVWQGPIDVQSGLAVWFAEFDRTQGWVVKNQSVFNPPWGERHPFYGYWGGKYHVCWFDGAAARIAMADSTTFEGFQSINGASAQYYLPGSIPGNSVPSAYAFNDDYAWVLGSDTSTGDEAIAYWKWNKTAGWSEKIIITETRAPTHNSNFPALLPVNETAWYIYYTAYGSSGPQLYYVKSADQGQTWGAEQTSNIASQVSSNSRPSFARYGNNYYQFLIDTSGAVVVFSSTDGVTWGNKQVLYNPSYFCAQGYAVDQKTLVWTASNTFQPKRSSQGHYGVGDQLAGVYLIPEMISDPAKPTLSYPSNGGTFAPRTTTTSLKTIVHGSQSYDVAFYWADGTFIGEDKLLTEGDIATVAASGLSDGQTYQWYAVARGATYAYWGGQPASTSDEQKSDSWNFQVQASQEPYIANEIPRDGSIGVAPDPNLAVTVTDYQTDLMTITFSTNASGSWQDIGTFAGVGNGRYSVNPTNMNSEVTKYYWKVTATDGLHTSTCTFSFTTRHASGPWWDSDWLYRKMIVIDHTKVVSNLNNFPVLIVTTDPDLSAHAQGNGNDIAFADFSGNKLPHEIESYNSATGGLVAWVNVPTLSATSDTLIYMYYGNDAASNQQNSHAVWDLNYLMVLHLGETTGIHYDSTRYAHDGTPQGGVKQDSAGTINGGDYFNGVDAYITVYDGNLLLGGMNQLTIETWAKQPTYHANGMIEKSGLDGYMLQGWSDQQMYFAVGGIDLRAVAPVGSYPLNQWYYLVGVCDGTSIGIYVNAILKNQTSKTTRIPVSSSSLHIGTNDAGSYFNGFMDEVRISNVSRSASWIATQYNNQYNPSGFALFENEEQGVPPERPVVSSESPVNGTVGVSINPELSIAALDYQGDLMTITFSTNASGSWQDIETFTGVGNGRYGVTPATMGSYVTEYWWRVRAVDAKAYTTERTYTFTTRPENYVPIISDPSPANGATGVSISTTMLSFRLKDTDGNPMDYVVATSPNVGNGTGTHVNNGVYYVYISKLALSTEYTWTVNASDEKSWTLVQYTFTTSAGPPTTIGAYYCAGLGYIGGPDAQGNFYAVWQQLTNHHIGECTAGDQGPHGPCTLYWGRYNATSKTWDVIDQIVTSNYEAWGTHPAWGYWDNKYHIIWDVWGTRIEQTMGSSTWEDFSSMSYSRDHEDVDGNNGEDAVSTSYSFDNEHAWIFITQVVGGKWAVTYVPWSKQSGWGTKVRVTSTEESYRVDCGSLLTVNRNKWIIYYTSYPSGSNQLRYVISTDQGQTWGPKHISLISSELGVNIRPTFARYGDTFYIFLVSNGGDVVVYKSTDGENWTDRQVIYSPSSWQWPTGVLMDQKHLIWTASDLNQWCHYGSGTGDQVAGIYPISELRANPGKPTNIYPTHGYSFPLGTTSVQLKVRVTGTQTYDVAFYWANGTYIGMDRLLRNGDTATITVPVVDDRIYEWYAIARGATHSYWGPPRSTTDEQKSDEFLFGVGIKQEPYILDMYPKDGSTSVELNPQLSVSIADFQGDFMNITFTSNASGVWQTLRSYDNVPSGVYNATTTRMNRYGWTYFWRIIAIDSVPGTSDATIRTFSFGTLQKAILNPFEEGWRYRKRIMIDHTKVSGNLVNFPVMIDITDPDLASKARFDGGDILLMDNTGTANRLCHEMEGFTLSTGRLIAWVKIPLLSASVDTAIYMYYGNPYAGNQQDVHGTWDSSFELVQHFEEPSGALKDSTHNLRDGSTYNGVTYGVAGQIDQATSYDGTDDYAKFASIDSPTQITVEIWTKAKQQPYWQTAFAKASPSAESWYSAWDTAGGYKIQWWMTDSSNHRREMYGTTALTGSYVWRYIVLTYNGFRQIGYVNGIQEAYVDWTGTIKSCSEETYIARNLIWGEPLNGAIDEFRISGVARSSAWISTCYRNQYAPSTFLSVGTEEEVQAPIILNQSPADGASNVPATVSELTFELRDHQGDLMNFSVTTSPDIGGISRTNIVNGVFSVPISGLSYSTTYTWRISVTDGAQWTNQTLSFTTESAFDLRVTSINIVKGGLSIFANDTYSDGSVFYYPVEVAIYNDGTAATQPFYVKLEIYWITGSQIELSTEILVPMLNPEESTVVNFANAFHPLNKGLYRLTATVDNRDDVREGNETNNILQEDNLEVTVMGDINSDGIVNLFDAIVISQAWGATSTAPNWDVRADLNHDGVIDILDAVRLSANWGYTA